MTQQATDSVLVYADYVCPFCYLGYVSLAQYREQRDQPLTVDWQPFDLRSRQRREDGSIDFTVDTGKDEEYFEQAKQNVERLADRYGVEMATLLAREIDSYDAQRLAWRAHESYPDCFETFHQGVFEALWEDGRDIGDRTVLGEIAAGAGLPDEFVDDTLADASSSENLDSAFVAAQERGISGVPTFVAGDHAASGAVPPDHLRRLIEGV